MIQPMTPPKPKIQKGTAAGGVASGAALAILAMSQFTPIWEGRSLKPYQDVVGVWTVCEGETRVQMRKYTAAECDAMSRLMYKEFVDHVIATTPGVEKTPYMLAGFADTAINIGKAGYTRSSMRSNYVKGAFREACRSILLYDKAGGKVWNGLALRRKGDASRIGAYEVCMADAVEAEFKAKGIIP